MCCIWVQTSPVLPTERGSRSRSNYLGIELGQEVKVLFQVSGQNGFDDEETETLELHVIEIHQEVVFGVRHEQVPGRGGVMVL